MLKTGSITQSPAKTPVLDFSINPGDHPKKGRISPETEIFYGKGDEPCLRLENGLYHIEYTFVCPYKEGCGASLSGESLTDTKEKHECDKCKIETENKDYNVSQIITLKEKPPSRFFSYKLDTNFLPLFTLPILEGQYTVIYWSKTGNRKDTIYRWKPMEIRSIAVGEQGYRRSGEIFYLSYALGYLNCEISAEDFEGLTWPAVISNG